MKASASLDGGKRRHELLEILWKQADRVFCRLRHADSETVEYLFLPTPYGSDHPELESVKRLRHEYELRDHLDGSWALRPLELLTDDGRTMLLVDYEAGEPLDRLMGQPMEIGRFLGLAAGLAAALSRLHGCGLIHKDIKPGNVLVDAGTGRVLLTGFGIASRLPRERQFPEPPKLIAGTFAYMAPEQTGRMNRSIDSRSDLYSLGATFYEMLTGNPPFSAGDPMEWVHCHIARQPVPPTQVVPAIPVAVSALTMKLLSKTAEDRYQTAAGVENDLRRCLREWGSQGSIHAFQLGKHDNPDRLMIPGKLYGREREVLTLQNAFGRIVSGGRPELLLVSGYAGIGKSSLVNEVHKLLAPSRGLFVCGKVDLYNRNTPYATLAQAFQSLVRWLLSMSEAALREWQTALREALAPNAILIVDLVPQLRHILGDPPPVPELPPTDAQGRFRLVLRRFIGVFARPEHPLALFLDDLQWLDAGTLDLIEELLTRSDLQHLLLIGAYRDNEVDAAHPLMRRLGAFRQGGATVHDIVLAPLSRGDIRQLLADSLRCDQERVGPLAELIYAKTRGNPFFAIQLVTALADEALLTFDYDEGRWSWDLERIDAKGYTDNVAELMVGRLSRLPSQTQGALQLFACMGSAVTFEALRSVCQVSTEELHERLWEAARIGAVVRSEESYRFLHDYVQEAAYSLLPNERRAATHLRIGMRLIECTPAGKLEDVIFEVVNQLNRGSTCIDSIGERERAAYFNLVAARRAKGSAAFASALQYGRAGIDLLSGDSWERNYELAFSIEHLVAECEVLTGEMAAAEARLQRLALLARDRPDLCSVTRLRLTLYVALDKSDRAVEVFLQWLGREGTFWSSRPTREDVWREYQRIWSLLGERQIEELANLPPMTDPDVIDTVGVFADMITPAWAYDEHFTSLAICRLVTLSLEHGDWDGAGFAYAWFAAIAGSRFANHDAGVRFGRLSFTLADRRGPTRYQARTYMTLGGLVLPWARHPSSGRELVQRAVDAAYRIGDLTFAAYSWHQLVTIRLAAGDALAEVQIEAERGVDFARSSRFGLLIHICGAQRALIRTLRGSTAAFGALDDAEFSERETERVMAEDANLALAQFFYWTRKCQARLFCGAYAAALEAALRAQPLLWVSAGMFETAEYHFYSALAHAMTCDGSAPAERVQHLAALRSHLRQLETWAAHNAETFESRALVAGAELARLEGRTLAAEDLYEKAIRSAGQHGFLHNEAIANELAARFYERRGLQKISNIYLRDARYCYMRWGASAKVSQLEQQHPSLRTEAAATGRADTIQAASDSLDLARVTRISEAVASEIVLERLIDVLMRTSVEQAGADRGLLILPRGDDYLIAAEVTSSSAGVEVKLGRASVTTNDLPEALFRYAWRTRESVLLDDALHGSPFAEEAYIGRFQVQSVLCLPIVKQTRLIGLLYLENRLTPHAFTPARMTILKLLASQAAISIENASLYRDLAQREAKIRRLVDANIIGLIIWNFDGRILEANDAFLSMVGYDRGELLSGRLSWRDLTPAEWLERDEQQLIPELKRAGRLQPFEKEFLRKDGQRVHVLAGVATFEEAGEEGVAFVLDLTERRRAAEALRELQAQLARANRLATMGQLTASIAHEVNQPIGAAHNNARAALQFLRNSPPDMPRVLEALECVVNETYRAGDIIGRIRNHVRKGSRRMEAVELNTAIQEVIALVRGELSKHRVAIQMRLERGLLPVHGDRVELQQVMLNLILNGIEAMSDVDDHVRELSVTTEERPALGVLVSVGDTGPGVRPQDLEQIFDSFYTTKADGVGIGLSICRSIIDSHGGRLWAEARPDRGAVFRFTLPLEKSSAART